MAIWPPTGAQQAVDIVAAVMAGEPHDEVETELRHWLTRRGAELREPLLTSTVDAIASGWSALVLPVPADAREIRVLAAR